MSIGQSATHGFIKGQRAPCDRGIGRRRRELDGPPCGRDGLAMAGIDPALVLAFQHRVTGDQLAVLEDTDLGRMVLNLDDPASCCVGYAVLIAAHRDHALLADTPLDGQNRFIWPEWQSLSNGTQSGPPIGVQKGPL